MRYLRPDIHNIFKLFTLQFIIIVAIILGAFQANAFSQNSITTPPNALEQDLSEYIPCPPIPFSGSEQIF